MKDVNLYGFQILVKFNLVILKTFKILNKLLLIAKFPAYYFYIHTLIKHFMANLNQKRVS